MFCMSVGVIGAWATVRCTGRYDNISFKIRTTCHLVPKVVITCILKEAGNTEEGREFQRREVEGKKPSLN